MIRMAHQFIAIDSRGAPAPEPARIAIFQALNLGDLLCATPALRALRLRYPRAGITVIGRPWARELLGRLSSVDHFAPFPGFPGIAESPDAPMSFAPEPGSFDLAVQMHGSGQQSNGYVASLEAPWSIGYGPPDDDRLTAVLPWVEHEPEPLRWLRLVAAAGAASESTRLELPITDQERHAASTLLGSIDGRPLIGLHAGSSLPNRRWPAASYAALADRMVQELDARIILTGSSAERELTAAVREAMHSPALDLAGATAIGEYAAVIAALDLLVTNDTSASHIAAATRTRSVILFGPTRPERWAPLDLSLHHIIDASAFAGPEADGTSALQALPPEPVARRCFGALREARVLRGGSRLERFA